MPLLLGVDTGGTFTDFVLVSGREPKVHKVLSTPDAPERAILQGIADLGLSGERLAHLRVVHGSTVATNAALESKGVRTVYIGNRGLADLLTIGRQNREALYDLQPSSPAVPVPPELCLETGGRLGADGREVEPLTEIDLAELKQQLQALAPQAVAINLLFSFLDDRFEKAIEAIVPAGVFVSRSSVILPEYKEYERGVTTWLNAWVGPLVEGYLNRLEAGLPGASVSVMQSSGTTVATSQAGKQAVHMLLSGPAGGLAGARAVAARAGRERLLTFDMGGTSTDVALIDGELKLTTEGRIGRYPVSVPMVDMHTIGAGGGSIAYVDAGGLLQVGPESAGATPGPACYGGGGKRPTVTDANLLLGRLRPDAFLGGGMSLDLQAAREAMASIAGPLGLSLEEAAQGVVRIANEHMGRALRVMSVQRGVDPRALTLVSFGGAGGLHVCALADELGMKQALVPVHAGVLSALGMLAAPRGRQYSHTFNATLPEIDVEHIEQLYGEMEQSGRDALVAEGIEPEAVVVQREVDLRYQGQSYTLTLNFDQAETMIESFHQRHHDSYGHRLELPVELVNLRIGLRGPQPELALASLGEQHAEAVAYAALHGIEDEVALWQRQQLGVGQVIDGPALILEQVSTTYLAPGWRCRVDVVGNLVLDRR